MIAACRQERRSSSSCQPIDLRDGLDGLAAKVRQITKPIALTDFSDRFAENQVKTLLSAA